jgi:hypothetical protein
MPKMITVLTADHLVMLQFVDDGDKILSSATLDRAQAVDISEKIRALADLIPEPASAPPRKN